MNESVAKRVLEVVDAGLCGGIGDPTPGKMCVEAAVCYALGEDHGDKPSCVADAVRRYKINVNDGKWSSDVARAAGLRRVAVAQLGSKGNIDEQKFAEHVLFGVVRRIVAPCFEKIGQGIHARAMARASTFAELRAAAYAAHAAADAAYAAADAAADAAAYAAHAAYAAADAAADAAAYAAHAAAGAAHAAGAAAYAAHAAADAADAAAGAAADARDGVLREAAIICEEALVACGSPGCNFLFLCGV